MRFSPAVLGLVAAFAHAAEIPSGTILDVRLRHPVTSYGNRTGDTVETILLSPIKRDGIVLLPAGTKVVGKLTHVRSVGLGFVNATATVKAVFNGIQDANGTSIPIRSRIVHVDNAREKVDLTGSVKGVHPMRSTNYRLSSLFSGLILHDPFQPFFIFTATLAVLRFHENEIQFPAGTELRLELLDSVEVAPPPVLELEQALTAAEQQHLHELLHQLPIRATTEDGKPSDLVNLFFVAEEHEIRRAFAGAGWVTADKLGWGSFWRTFRAVMETKGYPEAPMSTLRLDGRSQDLAFQKGLNTYSKRHHVRIWKQPYQWKGRPLWAATATHDVEIAFKKKLTVKPFFHRIDGRIDLERGKILQDLEFAGCAANVALLEREGMPDRVVSGGGEVVVTDRAVAAVVLNGCQQVRTGFENASPVPKEALTKRMTRHVVLTFRNMAVDANPVRQGYDALRSGFRAMRGKPSPAEPAPAAVGQKNANN